MSQHNWEIILGFSILNVAWLLTSTFLQWFKSHETSTFPLVQEGVEGHAAVGHHVRGELGAFSSLRLGTSKELAGKAQILYEWQKKYSLFWGIILSF